MTPRLTPLLVGAGLATLGALMLLRNLGVLPSEVRLWPLVLIVVGVAAVVVGLRQGAHDPPPRESAAVTLDGAAEARVVCKHGAGTLEVAGGAPAGRLLDGTFAGGVRQEVERVGDRLQVTLRHPSDPERLFREQRGLGWSLALSDQVPIDLDVRTGASRVFLDLSDVALRRLDVQTGASEVDVRLPPRGQPTVTISAGAAEVRVHVPDGMSASIVNRSALASVTVDEARFPRGADGFRDAGFDGAEHRATIELEGGVASFAVA